MSVPHDTSAEADRVLTDLLRRSSPAEHFAATRALSESAAWHAWRVVRENNPGARDDELLVRFVATYYGEDLAQRLDQYLCAKRQRAA
jgi:hypothetical protein